MFTKIFCPTDAHSSPARTYATMVPPSTIRVEITPKSVVDPIEAATRAERAIFETHQDSELSSSEKSNVVVTPEITVDDVLTRRSKEI